MDCFRLLYFDGNNIQDHSKSIQDIQGQFKLSFLFDPPSIHPYV